MNLLITGAWKEAKNYISKIENLGYKVNFMQNEQEVLPCEYDWVEAVICNGLFLHHDISKFTNLKYIQLTSAGYDRVPIEYIDKNKIYINNASGVYSIPMAEYALSMVLYLYKQIESFRMNQKNHIWEKNRNIIELCNKNICIIGCGNVGIECAKRFKAFNCKVTGVARNKINSNYFDEVNCLSNLKEIIPLQDIVILALPLTSETYHIIDEEILNLLKESAIFINFSRGAILDTNALIESLNKKKFYAILDVFEEEPLSKESVLWSNENIILTPHNSFVGDNVDKRLSELILSKLECKKYE